MIRARRVAAHAQTAQARLASIEWDPAGKHDRPSAHLADSGRRVVSRSEAERIERVPISESPQRMPWLRERVEPGGRQRRRICAERVAVNAFAIAIARLPGQVAGASSVETASAQSSPFLSTRAPHIALP